jgi:hypothetical protein
MAWLHLDRISTWEEEALNTGAECTSSLRLSSAAERVRRQEGYFQQSVALEWSVRASRYPG